MLTSRLLIFISLFWASLGQSLAQDQNSVEDYKACVQEATENQPMTIKELNERTEKLNECMNIQLNLNEGADNQTIRGPVEFSEDIFAGRKKKKSQPEAEPFKLVLRDIGGYVERDCGRRTLTYTLLPKTWNVQFKCDANDRRAQINGQWNAGSLLSQNFDTSTLGNVLSVIFGLDFEIDGNRYTDRVELDYQYNEAHVTFGMNGEKSRFKIVSMTPSQAKTPDKKTKWHALAELRLNKFETAAEEKATVTTAQKESDNFNKTITLNKVDGDGRYSFYADGVCTDGLLNGRCISRSDFNNLCRKVGARVYKDAHENPYQGAAFYGNKRQFARIWAARKFAGITGNRTQLRNNKCIFTFGYDGIVKGTRYSGRLACDLNTIIVRFKHNNNVRWQTYCSWNRWVQLHTPVSADFNLMFHDSPQPKGLGLFVGGQFPREPHFGTMV